MDMTSIERTARRARGGSWGTRPGAALRAAACGSVAVALTVAGALAGGNTASAATYDPAADVYSMKQLTEITGATAFWDRGYTGAGIDVAVIDTGVSPVEGLATPGKVIYGPDLSLESQAPNLARYDTNGHGTFMAGVIAGKDSALTAPYEDAPASAYRGIAPDARIVSVKVGAADGGVDVTQVIAAINWVVDHKNDNGMNIRIVNLAYGTNSQQPSTIDPLSFAVERAWKAGIVVVAAAGNTGDRRGAGAPGLANPAYNGFVIGVGGFDSKGTATRTDDTIGTYSASSAGCGSLCKRPDFVAVGSRLQGLRVPNSFIDATHPEGLLGTRFFRGSGTSQAAAVTSGTIALILQQRPYLSPDEVKRFITSNAKTVPGADKEAQGDGAIDLIKLLCKSPKRYWQNLPSATGTGSVELSRGRDHITRDGVALTGEVDIFGHVLLPGTAGSSWSGGSWNGSTWSGSTWSGSTWSGSTWSGSTWSGSTWSGSTWSGSTWSSSLWTGSSWSGATWSGDNWATDSWG
jgi:serine protease AprX